MEKTTDIVDILMKILIMTVNRRREKTDRSPLNDQKVENQNNYKDNR